MQLTPAVLPQLIEAVSEIINQNAEEVTALDLEIGDGDHVYNLQRGLEALSEQAADLAQMDWVAAWHKIGMILMSTIGGASGSLYGSYFVMMSKDAREQSLDFKVFAHAFHAGVDSIKKRGRSDVGEKTMLDVLSPVADCLLRCAENGLTLPETLDQINSVAEAGVESTRNMLATKGRASFLGDRTLGHIDAGAKTAQLMIAAISEVLRQSD